MFSSGDGVIVLGDSTTHGGKVVSAQSNYLLEGKPVAVVGGMVTCPKDGHSTCSIIEGHPTISLNGKPVAFHGCHTACGAALISAASGKHGLGLGRDLPAADRTGAHALAAGDADAASSAARRGLGGRVRRPQASAPGPPAASQLAGDLGLDTVGLVVLVLVRQKDGTGGGRGTRGEREESAGRT